MATFDIAKFSHTIVFPSDQVEIVTTTPKHITTAWLEEVPTRSLITQYRIAEQLYDTILAFENHAKTNNTELVKMFLQSVHWQLQTWLQTPLKKLESVFQGQMDLPFYYMKKTKKGEKSLETRKEFLKSTKEGAFTTFRDIFREVKFYIGVIQGLLSALRGKLKIPRDQGYIPTRCPRDILLEISFWNKLGSPTREKIHALVNPREELDLTYMHIKANSKLSEEQSNIYLTKFEPDLSAGVPAMHYVAVSPLENEWLVGSTAAQNFGLEGEAAKELTKEIRAMEIGKSYTEYLDEVFEWMWSQEKMMENHPTIKKKPGRRARLTENFRAGVEESMEKDPSMEKLVDYYDRLTRSSDVGIALNQNLGRRVNCWRCYTIFNYQENVTGKTKNEVKLERGKFEFDQRSSSCCAECVSSLRAFVAEYKEVRKEAGQFH
ncbi:hypothetical protein DM02DRAFT_660877 [Periconia macrospinosa]|uniref:Uncharacterized protein n=1 Tax=Periconia macrospinosa TaxID=97972 RepID=A0A2V1D927_9PLEO|nr:hypothetical protein DM02DRAFT_660877 [Periconia macrospinosa]